MLNATVLGNAIVDQMKSDDLLPPDQSAEAEQKTRKIWTAVARAIVLEFTGNAEVTPGSFASPDGAVSGKGKIT